MCEIKYVVTGFDYNEFGEHGPVNYVYYEFTKERAEDKADELKKILKPPYLIHIAKIESIIDVEEEW